MQRDPWTPPPSRDADWPGRVSNCCSWSSRSRSPVGEKNLFKILKLIEVVFPQVLIETTNLTSAFCTLPLQTSQRVDSGTILRGETFCCDSQHYKRCLHHVCTICGHHFWGPDSMGEWGAEKLWLISWQSIWCERWSIYWSHQYTTKDTAQYNTLTLSLIERWAKDESEGGLLLWGKECFDIL